MAAAIPGDGLPHIPGVSSMAELLDDIYASRYVTFATFSLLLYDHGKPVYCPTHLIILIAYPSTCSIDVGR
jgi:hypothetical protein